MWLCKINYSGLKGGWAQFLYLLHFWRKIHHKIAQKSGEANTCYRLVINTLKTPQRVEKKKFYLSNRIRVLGSQPVNVIAGKVWCLCLWTVFVFFLSPGNGPLWKAWLSDKAICLSLLHLHRQYVPRSSNKRMLIR